MKISRITELEKQLNELEKFFEDERDFELNELIDFTARGTAVFQEIGVVEDVISRFRIVSNIDFLYDKHLSPFLRTMGSPKFQYRPAMKEKLEPVWTAITHARYNLKRLKQENQLVPQWLMDALSDYKELNHIYSALKALEEAYENKSAKDMGTHTVTLLEGILNLAPELEGKDIGPKLQRLIDNKDADIRIKFGGLSRDFFRGLNNSRLIRNVRIAHPTEEMRHDIPLIVGITSTYLVITLLEATLANGDLLDDVIKDENIINI